MACDLCNSTLGTKEDLLVEVGSNYLNSSVCVIHPDCPHMTELLSVGFLLFFFHSE